VASESSKFTHRETEQERERDMLRRNWNGFRDEDKLELEKMLEREDERRQRAFWPNEGLRWVGCVQGAEL
jgi:hypothetical protein